MFIWCIVTNREKYNIPYTRSENSPKWKDHKIHPKYSSRNRDELSYCRDKSAHKGGNRSLFLKKSFRLKIMRFIEKNVFPIFVYKNLDYWSSHIATKYIIDSGTEPCSCCSSKECKNEYHLASLDKCTRRNHCYLGWKRNKTGFYRHHNENTDISHTRKERQNRINKLMKHKNKYKWL